MFFLTFQKKRVGKTICNFRIALGKLREIHFENWIFYGKMKYIHRIFTQKDAKKI